MIDVPFVYKELMAALLLEVGLYTVVSSCTVAWQLNNLICLPKSHSKRSRKGIRRMLTLIIISINSFL